jgi:thymidylate kinase
LAEGKHVICDRYADSTRVYQSARGLDKLKIENLIDNNQVFRRKFSYQFGFQKSGNDQVDLLNFINIIEK